MTLMICPVWKIALMNEALLEVHPFAFSKVLECSVCLCVCVGKDPLIDASGFPCQFSVSC